MSLSDRIIQIKPSATMAITQKAKEMQRSGKEVIALSAGEPDFGPPETAKKAGIAAIKEGFTHYTQVAGIPELREAICLRLKKDFQLDYQPNDIVVGCGAKSILFHLFQTLLNPGDEVIIPSPYWVSYPDQVKLAGGVPIILPTKEESGFVPKSGNLEKLITNKTKMLVLNSPSNPAGAVLSPEELMKIALVLKKHPNVWVVSDEIYALLVYDGFRQESIVAVYPEIKKQCIVVNGMSKAYAMTGWRIGYAAGPEEIIKALGKIQGQSTSNPSSIAQRAALGALTGDQSAVEEMRQEFNKRRDCMMAGLREIPEVTCFQPKGAFYCFPNFSYYFGKKTPSGASIDGSVELATFLLEEVGVALVPGLPFGAPQYLRFSFATSLEKIKKALDLVRQGVAKLK